MKIFVELPKCDMRDSFFTSRVMSELEAVGVVEYNENIEHLSKEELKEKLLDKDVVLTGWGSPKIDKYILEGNKTLKLIAHTGGTVCPVVDEYAYKKGIKVISGNEVYAESVAEAVVAYALLATRRIPYFMRLTENNGWFDGVERWDGILDKTIGLVSFGAIPRHLTRLLKPFRVKFRVYSEHLSDKELEKYDAERATLEQIFSECDIVSVHSAYTEQTHHMIDKRLLEMLKDGAVFINTARGGVIDEEALIEELEKNRVTAVLDVYEQEPLPPDHKLRTLPNVYAIPHMGGPTYDRREYVTLALIKDIVNMSEGKRLENEIPVEHYKRMTK